MHTKLAKRNISRLEKFINSGASTENALDFQEENICELLIYNITELQNLKQNAIMILEFGHESSQEKDMKKLQIQMNDLKEAIRILANSLALTDP